jgi:DNA modification methylase
VIDIQQGDCFDVMRGLASESIDAIVTDPPAGIAFMGQQWDGAKGGRSQWIAWLAERMAEVHRIARPGTYALVWAIPRTSHWTATALEDGGWVVRDIITHLFGTGWPKSKACLKPACEHWILAHKPAAKMTALQIDACRIEGMPEAVFGGATGKCYGEKAKVLSEPHPGGRWPANLVLSHSPDCQLIGSRLVTGDRRAGGKGSRPGGFGNVGADGGNGNPVGRLYGDETVGEYECVEDCPVRLLDSQSGLLKSGSGSIKAHHSGLGYGGGGNGSERALRGDSGGASRFFYCAKASRNHRGPNNDHPTVKSHHLMRWLTRLITPPGGTILDPFMGSGSTGLACQAEGFGFVGIEQEPEYFAIARRRLGLDVLDN